MERLTFDASIASKINGKGKNLPTEKGLPGEISPNR